jgi:hypothetical protein
MYSADDIHTTTGDFRKRAGRLRHNRGLCAHTHLAHALSLAGCLVFPACGSDGPSEPGDPRPGAAAFLEFWQEFDRTYPYFAFKQIDWNRDRPALIEQAASASDDSALVAVLREAVEPLRDVHVWFRRPDGSALASYVPPHAHNWDRTIWLGYTSRLNWHQMQTNWGWGRVGEIGYIAIGAWNTAQVKIAEVDAALEQLRETRALIIDVRMNGGGNDALALQLAQRFAATTVRYAAVRFRNGPRHTDFGPWMDREFSPRGPWRYSNPVYVLVGRGCFSSNESFIAAMGELPQVTLVGDTTGGSSGNPKEVNLVVDGRDTGWRYSVPRWMEVTASGAVIEWNGIAPDVVVPFDADAVAVGRDPVLDWAFGQFGETLSPNR